MAFRWTSLDPEDHTIEAFLGINTAANWEDFTKALSSYHAPMQNFVFADVDGNIGYYAPGALPIRAKGDGSVPVPGWTDEYDWTGYVPFDKLPHTYNPPEGFIVSANNKVEPDSYPYLITTIWAAPYRAQRITEMIQAKPKLSIDDVAAMQADIQSDQARLMLPYLLQAKVDDDRSKAALEMMKGWDGTISGDSPQAAIYEAWYAQLGSHIFTDELGKDLWENFYADQGDFIAMELPNVFKGEDAAWCDDVTTPQKEDCPTESGAALRDGLADMAKRQGSDDIKSWRWDRVHRATFPHNPLNNVAILKPIFSRSIPNGGDTYTVDVGTVRRTDLYNQYHGPSYRQVVDLSDLNNSRFIHTVGQSGYVLSSNYSNLIERWQRVAYLPMRYNQDTINAAIGGRLTLEP
jgi:penicillin amidase